MLLAVALTAYRLGVDIVFVDEYWSLANSGAFSETVTLQSIWQQTATVDPGGMLVLYHWLLAGWGMLLGTSLWAARLFSLLWGVLTIALTFRVGTELGGRRVGMLAAVFLTSSAFFLDFFHEARAYTQFSALTLLAVWSYLRVQRARYAYGWGMVLAVSVAAALYTHYVALAVPAFLAVWHVLSFRRTARWWGVWLALGAAGLLFSAWVTVTLDMIARAQAETTRQAAAMSSAQIVREWLQAMGNGQEVLLLGLLFLAATARQARLVWVWLAVSLGLLVVVNALVPFMVHLRYAIFTLPAGALLLAFGVARVAMAAWARRGLLLLWLAWGATAASASDYMARFFGQTFRAPADGMRAAIALLHQWATPKDALLFHIVPPEQSPFGLIPIDYLTRGVPHRRLELFELMNLEQQRDDNTYLRAVLSALDDAPFVWSLVVPYLPTTNKSDVVWYALHTRYALCDVPLTHPNLHVRFYAQTLREDAPQQTFTAPSGTLRASILRQQARDGLMRLVLAWQSDTFASADYAYSVQSLDAHGRLLDQADGGIPSSGCNTVVVAKGAQLQLVVYDWRSGVRLPTSTGTQSWQLNRP